MLIYVAGPYSSKQVKSDVAYYEISSNIAAARRIAIKLWEMGHAVICPHLNTQHFEVDCTIGYEDYLKGDFNIISRCDAVVLVNGWENSVGTCREVEYAESLGIPVYKPILGHHMYEHLPPLHVTEIKSPVQCQAFRETTGQMYRLHLSKNADYSPANVAGPGADGLMTRIWDKATRLMNLQGFNVFLKTNDNPKTFWQRLLYLLQGRVVIVDHIVYTEPKTPKHESVTDTLLDNAVYSIIFLLFLAGKWGH